MWQYNRTEELYHHGVLGMKWGVRRYQNADGSLTPAGRRKAKKLAKQYADVTGKKLIVKKKAVKEEQPKSIKEMSDAELQQKINRVNLERTYMKMLASEAPKPQTSRAKKFIKSVGKSVVLPAAKDASRDVLTNWLKKQMNNQLYGNNNSNKKNGEKYVKNIKNNKVNDLSNNKKKQKIGFSADSSSVKKTIENSYKNDLGSVTIDPKYYKQLNKKKK